MYVYNIMCPGKYYQKQGICIYMDSHFAFAMESLRSPDIISVQQSRH